MADGKSSVLTLHSPVRSKNAYKVRIVAEYLGITLAMPAFEMGVDNKTPEYLKMNPQGKVPLLQTPDGPIWESNAIARYVAMQTENNLLGTTIYEQAQVGQWIDFATTEIDKLSGLWLYPQLGFLPRNAEFEEIIITLLERALAALDTFLTTHTFLVGNFVTLADIVLGCNLYVGFTQLFSKEFTAKYPHVETYFWTLVNQPQFKRVLGDFTQLEAKPSHPVTAKATPAVVPSTVGSPLSVAKVEQAPNPKEPPMPKNEALAVEEEARLWNFRDPFDLLPPSTFKIVKWKRLYSSTKQKDFSEVAIKGFWEMFDPEGWSLWFSDYKYNEDNQKTLETMNKVGGFLQRLDFIRKNAFGKMLILGEEAPFKIKGVWIFRGQEIPKRVMEQCYDMELYVWTKADLSSEEQKARINAYFEEPDYLDGDKLLGAKCFK